MKIMIQQFQESRYPDRKTDRWLFLILLIEGASVMATELSGARLIAPFYGNSLYVWTAILLFSVSGLALGYYTGGLLTLKLPIRKILFSVLIVSSVLVFILPYTAKLFISLSSGMNILPGIILTGFALMVPPMLCFGMVGPLVVRWMTSEAKSTGKVAGVTYFTSTMGGILATFLFGLYLIPIAGIKLSTVLVALALAIIPLLHVAWMTVKKEGLLSSFPPSGKSIQEFPKRKTKKTALVKDTRVMNLYLYAVMEGATVMAVELISARMLAPWFGSSLHVWAVVLGITLLGLATGYYTGGRLAIKYPGRNLLMIVVLGASFFIMIMHLVSEWFPMLFFDFSPVISLIITSLFLILPPLILLGMIPTLLIGAITSKIDDSGLITGRVFTVSSFSGILAIPLFGFWIIPAFGLTFPSVITGMLIGLIPCVQLIRQKKPVAWIFFPAVLFCLLTAREIKTIPGIDVQYFSEGLLGQVLVADVKGEQASTIGNNLNGRMLFVNRMGQSQVDLNSGSSRWNYLIFSSAISSALPAPSKALVLGLGGGMMAGKLSSELGFDVDAVELDSRIAKVAHRFFGMDERVKVYVDDARHYMETTKKKYDLIFFDVFRGEIQPAHVLSLEAFKRAGTLLNRSGIIIVNFNGYLEGKIGLPGRSVYATLLAAGFETRILPTPGKEDSRNSLFIASANPVMFNNLRTPLSYHGKEVKMDSLFLPPGQIHLSDAKILTDDKPVLEWLNIKASASWRKDYTQTFTELFSKSGVPLFK